MESTFLRTLAANALANFIRNVWSHAIIFCGHFPDQTYTFTEEEVEDETRGGWYVRQLVGAANIDGSPLFHLMSGNLGFQVEHHLYPDMPSSRYSEIAPKIKDICERYELPYNTGPFCKAVVLGAPHHLPVGVPRRKAAAEARALPRRRTAHRQPQLQRGDPIPRPSAGRTPGRRPGARVERRRGSAAATRKRLTRRPIQRSASFFVILGLASRRASGVSIAGGRRGAIGVEGQRRVPVHNAGGASSRWASSSATAS